LGAVFVAFRESSDNYDPAVSITGSRRQGDAIILMRKDGRLFLRTARRAQYEIKTASGKIMRAEPETAPDVTLDGTWGVQFAPNLGAPPEIGLNKVVSWTEHSDPGVKYYSGTATYRRTFDLPAPVVASSRRILLDLGRVEVIASVSLNGRPAGVVWKRPWEIDITELVKTGANALQITVANLWPNRLIGDELLPEDSSWRSESPGATGTPLVEWPRWLTESKPRTSGRVAFATRKFYGKDSALLPSGLLGPVRIRFESLTELTP
jgi:hypothetical protein